MGSYLSKLNATQNHDRRTEGKSVEPSRIKQSNVFLWGCETDEEHKFRKKKMIEMLNPLKGEEGLIACGLEYRLVTLGEDGELVEGPAKESKIMPLLQQAPNLTTGTESCVHEEEKKEENLRNRMSSPLHQLHPTKNNDIQCLYGCNLLSMTRLFHKESNTMITSTNRKEFIADGAMYDIICRLAMEYSQEVMMRDGGMEWVTIPQDQNVEDNKSSTEPIRALVSTRLVEDESKLDEEPTLLIVTGKGHVRAGVFSRQHLLTLGLECSSAVPFVREARKRNMNLIALDPNAHGDRVGMVTFEKSMSHLFRRWEKVEVIQKVSSISEKKPKNLYMLSHSQSGAQFMRYLLMKSECYLPYIGAIVFTDSTHNIQWTKRKNQHALDSLFESEKSVYFRRSDNTMNYILNPFSSIGQVIDTDEFWKHRFGKIKTLCAGTSEHSLTNWFARLNIWEHFDRFLATNRMTTEEVGHTIDQ